ncbi:unnamed protein product, partial [Mesorhabditis belari]|uniref:SAGA-associated factor 11 n=1 Tax=Mesorhabditis belari TaxID=2138241 RepID=A0AAF3FH17_9BILA
MSINADNADDIAQKLVNDLIDSCTLRECFEVHRRLAINREMGIRQLSPKPHTPKIATFTPSRGKQIECQCTNCGRTIAVTYYAPHLEKCIGMGRRAARRKVQYNEKASESAPGSVQSQFDEEEIEIRSEDEEDWGAAKKKKKRSKNSKKKL